MDPKYDVTIDLSTDTSHTRQLRAVAPGSRVLEFGCATGYVSKALTEQLGCRVTGIELDPGAAEQARAYCERVVVGDLDVLDLGAELGGDRFDVALFGDVLEHVKQPGRLLAAARALLAPHGRVVATIPNVAHGDVRLALLSGRFEYRDLGLLDDTHIRFFTAATVRQLFEGAGLAVTHLDRLQTPLFTTELAVSPAAYPPEVVAFVASDPEATTYQFVVVAVPAGDALAGLMAERDRAVAERGLAEAARDAAHVHQRNLEAQLAAAREAEAAMQRELAGLRDAEAAARTALASSHETAAQIRRDLDEAIARETALQARITELEAPKPGWLAGLGLQRGNHAR